MFKFIAASVLFFGLAAHARTPLFPVDEAAQDPSFNQFRVLLTEIVLQKNVPELLKRVSPTIEFSFGEEAGKKGFINEWDLRNSPQTSALWKELEIVLGLGGKFDRHGNFVAPYTFAAWPEDKDGFENVSVISPRANVYAKANEKSAVIYGAGYEVLRYFETDVQEKWAKVEVPGGQVGYILAEHTRSPINYRAFFAKNKKGEWQMTVFIAGD